MEEIDVFKQMEPEEVDRIFDYFARLKTFLEEHGDYLTFLKTKYPNAPFDTTALDSKDLWEINNLIQIVEREGLEDMEDFKNMKYSNDVYQELDYLGKEGKSISSIFRKHKLLYAQNILTDFENIQAELRFLLEKNPDDTKTRKELLDFEKKCNYIKEHILNVQKNSPFSA